VDAATLANQAQVSGTNNTQRIAFNNVVRAGIAGFAEYFDIAHQVESSRDSCVWNVVVAGGGTAAAVQTEAGIHELKGE
jgi:hypothetical protein